MTDASVQFVGDQIDFNVYQRACVRGDGLVNNFP
jgi:hypothetical protein